MQFLETVALCLGSGLFTYSLIRFGDLLCESKPEIRERLLVIFSAINLGWLLFAFVEFV